eukprot:6178114-Pleurochrysis_carterae.AAC.3
MVNGIRLHMETNELAANVCLCFCTLWTQARTLAMAYMAQMSRIQSAGPPKQGAPVELQLAF